MIDFPFLTNKYLLSIKKSKTWLIIKILENIILNISGNYGLKIELILKSEYIIREGRELDYIKKNNLINYICLELDF